MRFQLLYNAYNKSKELNIRAFVGPVVSQDRFYGKKEDWDKHKIFIPSNPKIEFISTESSSNKTVEKITTGAYREMAKKAPWAWGTIYSTSQKGPLAHLSSRSNKIMAIIVDVVCDYTLSILKWTEAL